MSDIRTRGLRNLFRTFQYRNYRLFFAGQGVSLIGTWMQRVASGWLAYRLTNSVFLLGLVGFAGNLPSFLLAPLGGLAADRFDRRRMLIAIQSLFLLQAALLAVLTLTGLIRIEHLIALSVFMGAITAFDVPVRQSFVSELVDCRDDLGNAIALNSAMFNSARILGPSVAGLLIGGFGEGLCFLINAFTYPMIIIALLLMRTRSCPSLQKGPILKSIAEGFSYVHGNLPMRLLILLLALVGLMSMSYLTLAPAFARDVLHGGPHVMGYILSSAGAGAIFGAFFLASRKNAAGLESVVPITAALFGAGLVGLSLTHTLVTAVPCLMVMGFGLMVTMASTNTLLQTLTHDDKRGRVLSIYSMAFLGTAPFGSLMAGGLASKWGTPVAMATGGILSAAGALLYARKLPEIRTLVRPVFAEKGFFIQPPLNGTIPPAS